MSPRVEESGELQLLVGRIGHLPCKAQGLCMCCIKFFYTELLTSLNQFGRNHESLPSKLQCNRARSLEAFQRLSSGFQPDL